MLDEGRYISQLLAYEEEIVSTLKDILSDVTHYKFLLIDGAESDLLPQHHPACTSKTGNLSDKFYQSVIDNHFFFISANALYSLGLLRLFKGDSYSIEDLAGTIFAKDNIGLLSSGLISLQKQQPTLTKLL